MEQGVNKSRVSLFLLKRRFAFLVKIRKDRRIKNKVKKGGALAQRRSKVNQG
jgi:hypothetical protein